MMRKGVLVIAPFFRPSIGGAESYIDEVVNGLVRSGCNVYVHSYQPIIKEVLRGDPEETSEHLYIRRYDWIGGDLFHRFSRYPLFIFAYITPYLLIRVFLWMLVNHQKIAIVDGQGLNACFISKIIGGIFKKKRISTILALYEFRPGSLFTRISSWVIRGSESVILEKGVSENQIASLGCDRSKMIGFFWWVDAKLICNKSRAEARNFLDLKHEDRFLVLFVGRAIEIKGADILLSIARKFPQVYFLFITNNSGYLVEEIKQSELTLKNIRYLGEVPYRRLHYYYRAANLLCVPSRYEENAALVVSESISNGTPVIASNRGSLPYMISDKVGLLAEPSVDSFADALQLILSDPERYMRMTDSCEAYANNIFGAENKERILNAYLQN